MKGHIMSVKNDNNFNVRGRCYVKKNKVDGEIVSFVPDIGAPCNMYLDDLVFIMTIPAEDQRYAPAYCRLQEKKKDEKNDELHEFNEVRSVVVLRQKKNSDLLVCAPKTHVMIDLNQLVVIATMPLEGKFAAPCYLRKKTYNKVKPETNRNVAEITIAAINAIANGDVDLCLDRDYSGQLWSD